MPITNMFSLKFKVTHNSEVMEGGGGGGGRRMLVITHVTATHKFRGHERGAWHAADPLLCCATHKFRDHGRGGGCVVYAACCKLSHNRAYYNRYSAKMNAGTNE